MSRNRFPLLLWHLSKTDIVLMPFALKSQAIPHLPLEIFGLIAEHLTGDHAFGSAACVNLLSRAVHQETSPMLWESVYIDNYDWGNWEDQLPANLRYTKHVHRSAARQPRLTLSAHRYVVVHQRSTTEWLRSASPNLVMSIETGCVMLNEHCCILHVYRPVSYTTVFAVLGVPVEHEASSYMHSRCERSYSGEEELPPGTLLPDCAALKRTLMDGWGGWSRLVDSITSVQLYGAGVIHGNSPAHHQKVYSNILLERTSVNRSRAHDNIFAGLYVTAIQLLMMSVTPARPSCSAIEEQRSRFVEKEKLAIDFKDSNCIYAPCYCPYHLSLDLRADAVDDFVIQVSQLGRGDYQADPVLPTV